MISKITTKRVLRYAAMGFLPSQENAELANEQLIKSGLTANSAPTAFAALKSFAMGILPTQPVCEAALAEIV